MRKRGGIFVALALGLAVVAGVGRGVAQDVATPVDEQDDGTDVGTPVVSLTQTIVVVERAETDTVIDLGEAGDTIGDLIVFGNPVYDETNTDQVGVDQGSCVLAIPGIAYECSWTLILEDGQLVVQGPINVDGSDSVLAVTGGTGAYSGTGGEMLLEQIDDEGNENRFTYTLR